MMRTSSRPTLTRNSSRSSPRPLASGGVSCHLNEEERNRMIDQYLLSEDESTIVCSFYGRHVVVLDVESRTHVHTLTNKHSLLLLHQAELTINGNHLVHTNYDDVTKTSYLTVWDLKIGKVIRRLKNEPLICGVAVAKDAKRVVFATEDNFLKIWEPHRKKGHRRIAGYDGLCVRRTGSTHEHNKTKVFLMESAKRAVLFAQDISLWDLDAGYVVARFKPDIPFNCCTIAMNGRLIVAGMRDQPNVVTIRLLSRDNDVTSYGRAALNDVTMGNNNAFGEKEERDSEDSEDEFSADDEDDEL